MAIRLYWWTPPGGSNYGDALSPWIVSRVFGVRVEYAPIKSADMIAIGSILPFVVRGFDGIIWGSGTMQEALRVPRTADIRLLRGPVSQALCGGVHVPVGDPALLIPRFFDPPRGRYRLGIMPHHEKGSMKAAFRLYDSLNHPEVVLIDPLAPVEAVTALIGSCKALVSASLHGIIVADAYGVHNTRVRFHGSRRQGGLKFMDYGLSVERALNEVELGDQHTLNDLLGITRGCASRRMVEIRQKDIMRSVNSGSTFPLSHPIQDQAQGTFR